MFKYPIYFKEQFVKSSSLTNINGTLNNSMKSILPNQASTALIKKFQEFNFLFMVNYMYKHKNKLLGTDLKNTFERDLKNKDLKRTFEIFSSAHMIPHYKKRHTGGEDSFLIHGDLLMIADGVGGWACKGIDPGKFSRELRDK